MAMEFRSFHNELISRFSPNNENMHILAFDILDRSFDIIALVNFRDVTR